MKSLFALFSKIKHEYISYYLDMPSIFLTSQLQKISQITFKAHHQLDRQMHYLKTSTHEGYLKFAGFFLALAFSLHIRGKERGFFQKALMSIWNCLHPTTSSSATTKLKIGYVQQHANRVPTCHEQIGGRRGTFSVYDTER